MIKLQHHFLVSMIILIILQSGLILTLLYAQVKQAEMVWQVIEYNQVMKKKLNVELSEFRNGLFVGLQWKGDRGWK